MSNSLRDRCSPGASRGPPPPPKVHCPSTSPPTWASTHAANQSTYRSCTATSCSVANPAQANPLRSATSSSHAALCTDVDLVLIDGKLVELLAVRTGGERVRRQQHPPSTQGTARPPGRDGQPLPAPGPHGPQEDHSRRRLPGQALLAIDELAYFSVTVGTPEQQEGIPSPSCVTSSPVAAPQASSSSPQPSDPARTSSPPHCATCSPTGSRSAAPPTPAPTSSSAPAGPKKATPPKQIAPDIPRHRTAPAPKAAFPRRSKPHFLTDLHVNQARPSRCSLQEGRMMTVKPVPAGTLTAVNDGTAIRLAPQLRSLHLLHPTSPTAAVSAGPHCRTGQAFNGQWNKANTTRHQRGRHDLPRRQQRRTRRPHHHRLRLHRRRGRPASTWSATAQTPNVVIDLGQRNRSRSNSSPAPSPRSAA